MPGLSFSPPTDETGGRLYETGSGWVVVLERPDTQTPNAFGPRDIEGMARSPRRSEVVRAVEARLQAAGHVIVDRTEPQQGPVLAAWTFEPPGP